MKIKIKHFVISLVALLLLVVCVDYLLGFPRVFSINRDFDLNSGDVRVYVYVYVCFLKIKNEIKTTPFSQEVRRLGIDIQQERKWIGTQTKVFMIIHDKYICSVYGGVPTECNFLIWLFDHGNVPDENRRIILQKFVTILQTGDRRNVPHMITEELQAEAEKLLKVEK